MSDGEINVDSIDGEVLTTANIVGQLYPQGEKGDPGDPGQDGFSPTVTTEKVGKTTTITITDAQGEHTATILDGADGQGSGDMRTEVYDINQNGIVDDAEKVNGHTVGTDVPADAKFTDTTYTAGTGIDITGNVITNTQTSAEWGNITGTLSDQTDLKNALDDKADASDIPTKVSDLTNDSGFIDKDVNNLTNYDTSTTVDTKISNSEEVLIGSDSGIKASHELWVDTNDITPYVNSEISNSYGTAQNLGYSQEYVNTKLAEKLDATGGTISGGLTVSGDLANKQFDLFNDSSGANWKAFLKNKIDYCIANMNTTKQLTSMFINGGWSGVTCGNGICTKIYNRYTLTWFGFKGTYFCLYDGNSYQYYVLGGNNYYTNEDVIGIWTNGKPIYRIVVPTTGNNNVIQKVAEISNMDTLITAKCYVKSGSTTRIVDSVWWGSLRWASQIYSPNGSDITIECGEDFTAFKNGASIYTTIEYTKTTD